MARDRSLKLLKSKKPKLPLNSFNVSQSKVDLKLPISDRNHDLDISKQLSQRDDRTETELRKEALRAKMNAKVDIKAEIEAYV
jgi:hypothetical protein